MSKKKLTQGQKRSMAYQRMNNAKEIQEKLEKKNSKKTIWQKRGQTEDEYKKKDTSGTAKFYGVDPSEKKQVIKQESNPNSIQSLKKKLRSVKGTGKFLHEGKLVKATSKLIRETISKK